MVETQELVTISRACELCDVSRRTIYNWMRDGKLTWVRTAGGNRRIQAASLFRSATGEEASLRAVSSELRPAF